MRGNQGGKGRDDVPGPSGAASGEQEAAREAVLRGWREAEALLDAITASVPDLRDKQAVGEAIEAYMARWGQPQFRITCYRCGQAVVELPLVYPTARGRWTWMPPSYYVARFSHDPQYRQCPSCGAPFPPVDLDSA